MNKALQSRLLKKYFENRIDYNKGHDISQIDFNAFVSEDRSYNSNKEKLLEKYGNMLKQEEPTKAEIESEKGKLIDEKIEYIKNYWDNEFQDTEEINQDISKNEIWAEMKRHSPYSEVITLSTLLCINQGMNIINISPAGQGKSWGTSELLKLLGFQHTVIKGHITPKQFFNSLKIGGIIVLDESATILRNHEILNLLLSALWGGIIEWGSEQIQFDGCIIFNCNFMPNTVFSEALTDRTITNKIHLTSRQIKEKIKSARTYKPNMEIWNEIKKRIKIKSKLTMNEEDKIYEKLEKLPVRSVRDRWRLLKIAKFMKSLFGNIINVNLMLQFDIIDEILDLQGINRADKIRKIAEIKDISIRTAQRWTKARGF